MDRVTTSTREMSLLRLPDAARRCLVAWAGGGYPHEACGVLLGRVRGNVSEVVDVRWADNLAADRRHDRYVIDPDVLFETDREARKRGLEVIGMWHTHPDHPARPSDTDRAHAWDGYVYVIVAVHGGSVTEVRCWSLEDDQFVEGVIEPW